MIRDAGILRQLMRKDTETAVKKLEVVDAERTLGLGEGKASEGIGPEEAGRRSTDPETDVHARDVQVAEEDTEKEETMRGLEIAETVTKERDPTAEAPGNGSTDGQGLRIEDPHREGTLST